MTTNTITIDNDNNAVSAIDNGNGGVMSVSPVRYGCDDKRDRDDKIDATQFAFYGPLEWRPDQGYYVHSWVLLKGVLKG